MAGSFVPATRSSRRGGAHARGALLRGLDRRLQNRTQLPVRVAQDPLTCAALAVGRALDDLPLLRKVAILA
ncbi:MAG: hypothetical protein DMD80_23065 [Candidatus Rokuibacteriota bacterium]|nr:MAG: hypothetical protein DMD80_23065 [Candidatus Rokubacteria bacterium]PYN25120.1 MAG: hypothetical protein DMD76_13075 [Candidatus Rokubacteria bacterium]